MKAMLVAIGLWALANGLWLARDVLFITFFTLLNASFLSIFVEPLEKQGVSGAVAAPLVLLGFLLILAALFVYTWPTLLREFSLIQRQLPPAVDAVQDGIDRQMSLLMALVGATVHERAASRASVVR